MGTSTITGKQDGGGHGSGEQSFGRVEGKGTFLWLEKYFVCVAGLNLLCSLPVNCVTITLHVWPDR